MRCFCLFENATKREKGKKRKKERFLQSCRVSRVSWKIKLACTRSPSFSKSIEEGIYAKRTAVSNKNETTYVHEREGRKEGMKKEEKVSLIIS